MLETENLANTLLGLRGDISRLESELNKVRTSSTREVPCETKTDLDEALHELESLELALVREKQRVSQLLEEKEASEAAHARDINVLEAMLEQAILDKDHVVEENERLKAECMALRSQRPISDQVLDCTLVSWKANEEVATTDVGRGSDAPSEEPEIERSGEFDFNKYC
mmetsp:Transcript_36013/g.78782  ORF Transcript_36013/g.78782 Transcript_36013/m.78782 type:complete len:169 (+) Transcript_36013:113-619(+)|eukprot:CAMPEP_0170609492 /NCGR_PEP_ID=MMETSP0224-20130122/22157_1 /TAXON_ID=285029 /ORGANISM="Togula jolla, Strain CCCM 725" /LENGTH=168 /DNA_ID=CAMNT_0010934809 /DNA_START=116 /DNA_END=622 /DNA_ORIENTATION=+